METNFIQFNGKTIYYPVGHFLNENLPIIKNMGMEIKKLYGRSKKDIVFWVRGSSGTIISSIICNELKNKTCHINYIKKQGERSHQNLFRCNEDDINIIVDDFIESGETIREIIKKFDECFDNTKKFNCLCIGGFINKKMRDSNIEGYFFDRFDNVLCVKLINYGY